MSLSPTSNGSYFTYSSPTAESPFTKNLSSSDSQKKELSNKYSATYNTQQAYGDPHRYRAFTNDSPSSSNSSSGISDILHNIAQINDHLYLCAMSAVDVYRLRALGVTLVVSAIPDRPPSLPGIEVLHIPTEDFEHSNISIHFDKVSDRIYEETKRGGISLVHCMAGISRSSTLVLAYLMKYQKISLREAFQHVRSRRPCVFPNVGFWRQLLDYEERISGHRTIKMVNRDPDCFGSITYPDVVENEMTKKSSGGPLGSILASLGIKRTNPNKSAALGRCPYAWTSE